MPYQSKAQAAAMHAAAAGKSSLGIPQSVAQKFVADSAGQSVKRLPRHVKHKIGKPKVPVIFGGM